MKTMTLVSGRPLHTFRVHLNNLTAAMGALCIEFVIITAPLIATNGNELTLENFNVSNDNDFRFASDIVQSLELIVLFCFICMHCLDICDSLHQNFNLATQPKQRATEINRKLIPFRIRSRIFRPIEFVSKVGLEREYMMNKSSQVIWLRYIVNVFRKPTLRMPHVIHAENKIQKWPFCQFRHE